MYIYIYHSIPGKLDHRGVQEGHGTHCGTQQCWSLEHRAGGFTGRWKACRNRRCERLGKWWNLWGILGISEELWGIMGIYGEFWGFMGIYGDFWGFRMIESRYKKNKRGFRWILIFLKNRNTVRNRIWVGGFASIPTRVGFQWISFMRSGMGFPDVVPMNFGLNHVFSVGSWMNLSHIHDDHWWSMFPV